MPNRDRGRIRAAALHERYSQEDAPYRPLEHADRTVQALSEKVSVGVLKGNP